MFLDISITDKMGQVSRDALVEAWENNNMSDVLSILNNSQMANKGVVASVFNAITTGIVTLEELNDPTFKADKIKVSATPPTGLSSGQIYFKIV